MLAASLSIDVWLGVGFIAAVTVLACLGVISAILRHELEFVRVVSRAKRLHEKLILQVDAAEAQHLDQTNPAAGRPEMTELPTPTPGPDGSTESEEIMVIPPDPEPAATQAADAA